MQIVIDIDEGIAQGIIDGENDAPRNIVRGFQATIADAIKKGTPLPKGHGKLSDMDELVKNIVKEYGVNSIHELPQDIKMFYDKFINSAPTILDATFDYKLKNYAFFRKEEEK